VIELDSFLDKNKGSYVDHLDIEGVRNAARSRRFIVEGVCLLKVIELAGFNLDLLVYVQRHHLGLWADEEYLGLGQSVEEHLKKERHFLAIIKGSDAPEADLGLAEEIIRYHHEFVPHEKADLIFVWKER
jgi:hypothetical protein